MFRLLLPLWFVTSIASADYEAASKYLEGVNGHAMLVYEDGKLVFERYLNGHTAEKGHLLASGTKSFSGFMAVAAQEDGLLKLDEKLSETITEWKEDPQKKDITIRQLLSLSSGIAGGETGQVPSYKQALAQAKMTAEPGKRFQYGPIPYQIFGELMRRKLTAAGKAKDALDYLQQRLLTPLGMRYELWREDADKMPHLPSGAFFTAREWAKFGLLVLNGGSWEGKQIVKPESLAECFKPAPPNPNYGMTFWKSKPADPIPDLVMAAGKGKQKLFIIPSRKLLIVQFADAEKSYREEKFLSLAVGDTKVAGTGVASDADAGVEGGMAKARIEQNFSLMDKDGDGRVSRGEAGEFAERLFPADADQDGFLTLPEALAMAEKVARFRQRQSPSGKK
jgi:CubicO group peptidase (beta-lactamase class C family)